MIVFKLRRGSKSRLYDGTVGESHQGFAPRASLQWIHTYEEYPGAKPELVNDAWLYADRLSVNIEIPNEASLRTLAPEKDFKSVFAPMRYIQQGVLQSAEERKRFRYAPRFAPPGQSTPDDRWCYGGYRQGYTSSIIRLISETYDEACLLFGIHSGKCV